METLTLELSPALYRKLEEEAGRTGQSAETLVAQWVAERLSSLAVPSERERAIAVLQDAGLLTELGPELKRLAGESSATLEEVSAALSRPGSKPLSEIILEQRGPKD
ncbi:MAG: hypothetical protein ACLFVO_26780 [Chloroflexaceae bacterium]